MSGLARLLALLALLQAHGATLTDTHPEGRSLVGDLNAALAALKTCKEDVSSLTSQVDSSVRAVTGPIERDARAVATLLRDYGLVTAGEQTALNAEIAAVSTNLKANAEVAKVTASEVSDLLVRIEADIGEPVVVARQVAELENLLDDLQGGLDDLMAASQVEVLAVGDHLWEPAQFAIEGMQEAIREKLAAINDQLVVEVTAMTLEQDDMEVSGGRTVASLHQYLTHF